MANLGYVGLGLMGGAVVKRLLEKGHVVTGYNRTRSKVEWLEQEGMRYAQTPREAAESADIVFSMVTDTKALHAIVDGPDGILAALKPGKIYIDMSTVDAAASRERRSRSRDRRADAGRARVGQSHHAQAGRARDHGWRPRRTRSSAPSLSCRTSARR